MMREFRDENFEEFLKHNADNLRMRAPDRVWQKLSGELNRGKRRFGIGLSAFFLVTSVLGYLTIDNQSRSLRPAGPSLAQQKDAPLETTPPDGDEMNASKGAKVIALVPKNFSRHNPAKTSGEAIVAKLSPAVNDVPEALSGERAAGETPVPYSADAPLPQQKDNLLQEKPDEANLLTTVAGAQSAPWTIESATNLYFVKRKRKESRFQTQYHFAPTISYRRLSENKSYLRHSSQLFVSNNYNALYNSVNSMVTHKPDIGFEFGITEKY